MKPRGSSELSEFRRLRASERVGILRKRMTEPSSSDWIGGALPPELADRMVENAVGVMEIPLGVATYFRINQNDVLVPMAIEEPSVIAAASNGAKMVRLGGGFTAQTTPPLTVAQIEILGAAADGAARIRESVPFILALANQSQPELVSLGGGARNLEIRERVGDGNRMVLHLEVDCVDAMGANSVNTMAEVISPKIEEICRGKVGLRILTNLAEKRLVEVSCKVPFDGLARKGYSGAQVAKGVARASDFASADPYRAATHNKGIFNGIDGVLLATGNDWRAVEAGGHAYAAMNGEYAPLTTWRMDRDTLVGSLKMPMAVGIVGGAAKTHPTARFAIETMGLESAAELAWVAGSCGLACNLAALAALSSEGIQRGHMRLHKRKNG